MKLVNPITLADLKVLRSQLEYAILLNESPNDDDTRPLTEHEKQDIVKKYGDGVVLIGDFVIKRC